MVYSHLRLTKRLPFIIIKICPFVELFKSTIFPILQDKLGKQWVPYPFSMIFVLFESSCMNKNNFNDHFVIVLPTVGIKIFIKLYQSSVANNNAFQK